MGKGDTFGKAKRPYIFEVIAKTFSESLHLLKSKIFRAKRP